MVGLRSQALNQLARLGDRGDLDRIAEGCTSYPVLNGYSTSNTSTGRIPMGHKELDNLLALCQAATLVQDIRNATRLLQHLSPYVPESCYQALEPSPFLRKLAPSPWEVLTCALVDAVLTIGENHPDLRDDVAAATNTYIENCHGMSQDLGMMDSHTDGSRLTEHHEIAGILALNTSLLGFLSAASKHTAFWTADERFQMIGSLQALLTERFVISSETVLSSLRSSKQPMVATRDVRQYIKSYAAAGRPLSTLLLRSSFMAFVQQCAALMIFEPSSIATTDVLSALMARAPQRRTYTALAAERISNIASQEIASLEEDSDYQRLGSRSAKHLVCATKASSLVSYLCCSLLSEEAADPDILSSWLETSLVDPARMADPTLASTTLKCLAVFAVQSITTASNYSRSITRILTSTALSPAIGEIAAESLVHILKILPQDTVYNILFSLGNSLSSGRQIDAAAHTLLGSDDATAANGNMHLAAPMSSLSLSPSDGDETLASIRKNVITAIVMIARKFKDEKLIGLALSMLVQKVGRVSVAVDLSIIRNSALLASDGVAADFNAILRFYVRLSYQALTTNNADVLIAVEDARLYLSQKLKGGSDLYSIYLEHLLSNLISQGEAQRSEQTRSADPEIVVREIGLLLRPLALLAKCNSDTPRIKEVDDLPILQRDAWYNIVTHGFSSSSVLLEKHESDLRTLARYTRPLITEERATMLESDIDLNIVLRRGKSQRRVTEFRQHMMKVLPRCESDIKDLDYSELVFLETVHLVESLRASSGYCTQILEYFLEPHLKGGALSRCVEAVAIDVVNRFLDKTVAGQHEQFSAPFVAEQLSLIFIQCCNRIQKVQQVAYACAQRMIDCIPSALCQRKSIFTLLDLLTLMWSSCLEAESNEYEWRSSVTSQLTGTTLRLSDDYDFRRYTLRVLHTQAKDWILKAINTAPLDIKGLFQTYLSEYVEDEAFGHMSLGRSFAVEMGSVIPATDQRLSAIGTEDILSINTASDFVAQYTTRQEYRYTDPLRLEATPNGFNHVNGALTSGKAKTHLENPAAINRGLAAVERSIVQRHTPPPNEVRDVLRRAASLLCRSSTDENTTIGMFVRIPFLLFTKQSIKFGLSLWMGVIKENPRMEPRILIEILENWKMTVEAHKGLFGSKMNHPDPFFVKEEFSPSDREGVARHQQRVHDAIAPHFRILQFLASHYYASRLSNVTIEKAYHRFLKITLRGLRSSVSHPLAREAHLHIVLLALKILRHSTTLSAASKWRLKDDILTAGLAWFQNTPRWSYGGNRLQVKAETHLLADVHSALKASGDVTTSFAAYGQCIRLKQELLEILVVSEQTRLMVWLFPLDHGKRHYFASGQHSKGLPDASIGRLAEAAWQESPSLAMMLLQRFTAPRLQEQIRAMILYEPEKALEEPEALQILLGPSLPKDVQSQLKYLLYWSPVNPITAVTYFLPAYGNHPNILQYALRALEYHSVDVTFFYVPQIVQALRYDGLGYVERYIVETGKFSQMFAHQIIWNIKANAYKDEDATEPDPMKPTLDQVMDNLISSFAGSDKAFYEREFAFFDGVTGISGKLRPLLKKSKPEKKAKIEEELRLIQIDVGVYLPSNPDGVVVGIDRKSGKPLQSHAKTPFMATFRIRKDKHDEVEEFDAKTQVDNPADSYEVWQSAIFKVGDDCRQDVLALQMIAAFRGIFHNVGLPVFVFPYRVTATAPGCGVIDVLPNSISRDMLGREAVNGLYEWFVSRFGGEESIEFQQARGEFVKSMAAYSIISYLLQFKDRHNGNIMLDDAGHILHIDFGFCFDIAPGGVKFERAPFKLTKEMVAVMGGSPETQSFRWFEELCIKAFLASRMHVKPLVDIVVCMLDSGLPCFKPETIKHFKERFVLEKSDREAADFVRKLVRTSYANQTTKVYDQFQLMTNGIPY